MSNDAFIDYYELLVVATDAEPKQIRASFIRLSKMHHPDVGGSTAYMQKLTIAYRTLISISSRRSYDLLHDFNIGGDRPRYSVTRAKNSQAKDMSDEEIDDFIDTIYTEYKTQPKPKTSLFGKLRNII